MANNNSKTNMRIKRRAALERWQKRLELLQVDIKVSNKPEALKPKIEYVKSQIKILEGRV